jgi:hypothetical protein
VYDRWEAPSSKPAHLSPDRAINTGKFVLTRTAEKKSRDLPQFGDPGSGTILRKELPDLFPQDLVAGRAQMDLIADKESRVWLAVVSEHVRTDVDVFCLGLCREKVFHQPVKLQDVVEKHHARRTWFYGDKRDRYGRGIGPEDCEQLLEGLENFLRRRTDSEVVVPGVDHDRRRFAR